MKIEEFIEASNNAQTLDELFSLLTQALAAVGLDRVVFSLLTEHAHLRKDAEHAIVSNYPEHWLNHYMSSGYEVADPVRNAAFASNRPFSWKQLLEVPNLNKHQKTILQQGEEAGLYGGVGVPLRDAHGAIAGIGAASSVPSFEATRYIVSHANLLSVQFYHCYLKLMTIPPTTPAVVLEEGEREVLIWLAKGLSKKEISQKTSIKYSNVDYYARNAFSKLKAHKAPDAVIKALHQGLIQL